MTTMISIQKATSKLKKLEQQTKTDVGKVYQTVLEESNIKREALKVGSAELKRQKCIYSYRSTP